MKKEEIQAWDMKRILLGAAPAEFLIEVFVRTLIIYLILMLVLRILGKRMDGQLTIVEMAVMITFGAIVSVPMQIPERGILLGVAALIGAIIFQRGLNWLTVKYEWIEKIIQDSSTMLIKDGILQLDEMYRNGISKQDLYATLRSEKIFSLGRVKRLYFEACGIMNVYEHEDENIPGLPIVPSGEENNLKDLIQYDQHMACTNCGNVSDGVIRPCTVCGEKRWIQAVI